jgi:urease accessory protein
MLEVYERLGTDIPDSPTRRVVLTHQQRDRGRLRTVTTDGEELRIFLERGTPLQIGECLRSQCGQYIIVEGAMEPVVTATCEDWETFSLACYHLGNRHVKVQLGARKLRILPDHVLEEMLVMLGMELSYGEHMFVPVSGAYAGQHSHGHHHSHDHDHEQGIPFIHLNGNGQSHEH